MPRIIHVTVPPEKTDELVEEVRQVQGVIGVRVQKGISLLPPGDSITIESPNRSLHALFRAFHRHRIGLDPGGSITTLDPISIISSPSASNIVRDTSESTWEEMELLLSKESNMSVNPLLLMLLSGILAAIGIATNAIHIVVGAMAIAPGFEPIVRISLGIAAKNRACWRGITDTITGYGALMAGAGLTAVILPMIGTPSLGGESSYLSSGALITYWTTFTLPSLFISIAAGIGGAILIATNRSILTAGVMIALSLIPAAAITGMALVSGDLEIAGKGILRWSLETGCIVIVSLGVFLLQRILVQKRETIL